MLKTWKETTEVELAYLNIELKKIKLIFTFSSFIDFR